MIIFDSKKDQNGKVIASKEVRAEQEQVLAQLALRKSNVDACAVKFGVFIPEIDDTRFLGSILRLRLGELVFRYRY